LPPYNEYAKYVINSESLKFSVAKYEIIERITNVKRKDKTVIDGIRCTMAGSEITFNGGYLDNLFEDVSEGPVSELRFNIYGMISGWESEVEIITLHISLKTENDDDEDDDKDDTGEDDDEDQDENDEDKVGEEENGGETTDGGDTQPPPDMLPKRNGKPMFDCTGTGASFVFLPLLLALIIKKKG